MTSLSLEEKKRLILDHEWRAAKLLAVRVLDKPKPPLWMILIPIFFVFFAQKMKQYTNGIENFVENYMKVRRQALALAVTAVENNAPDGMDGAIEVPGAIPAQAEAPYRKWIQALSAHYCVLLKSRGENVAALLRNGYSTQTDYLLQCNFLNDAEHAVTQALLPGIEGDRADLLYVIDRMHKGQAALQRQEADALFSGRR